MNTCFPLLLMILWFFSQLDKPNLSYWKNPGFEGAPGRVANPVMWPSCGKQSTPDLLPGIFDVVTPPAEGDSYVGLITRSNGQKEDIRQELSSSFKKNQCYQFSVHLARSDTYLEHHTPVGLKIWLGTGRCVKSQLIHHEKIVRNTSWRKVKIQFTAQKEMKHILLEPSSAPGLFFDYSGNVLIDNLSKIEVCNRS